MYFFRSLMKSLLSPGRKSNMPRLVRHGVSQTPLFMRLFTEVCLHISTPPEGNKKDGASLSKSQENSFLSSGERRRRKTKAHPAANPSQFLMQRVIL